ncbi:Sodium/hydrogen exchanger family-domain-containing protein [Leucosporidium creatinivorum]|uniref:Sodium/hydrogen exchanger family-domain-containing protein n=1 Tax=Leucosporidium creatinivorum TaxID=106004 RepID=A0A1Y2DRN3_9BASI|nr:Sodium/hydrogen exchanger family-domain-containing protein [Leucosporidium creatinivorum]
MATPFSSHEEKYFHLDVSHISLCLLVLGAYFCTINQLSYWLKEKLFISSALISVCVGIAFGPIGANVISPWEWTNGDEEARHELTFQLTRLVVGIQVMFAGISLPGAYLKREALSLTMLLLPIMILAWFVAGGFLKLFIPSLTFLEALCISSCVTPTDPILANAIVKGRYAEKYVPKAVRDIISAESGANDGLGYPFMFITIFLMQRKEDHASIGTVIGHWIVSTWLYQIGLACAIGAVIGYIARKTLKEAHNRQLIDHESFLAYGLGLTFLTLGVVGVLGSDDVLACFIAGNSLTWYDFVRVETEDDTFQDVIDSILNASIFIYLGALIPWSEFGQNGLVPWKLVVLCICILAFRRLPWVMALWKFIPALPDTQQALFAGWFGPIGVSGVYYAQLAIKELPEEREHLRTIILPVVLFVALSSTIVHGVTIPITKFAPKALRMAPRAFTRTQSTFSTTSHGKRKATAPIDPSTIGRPNIAGSSSRPPSPTLGGESGTATPPSPREGSQNGGNKKDMVEVLEGDKLVQMSRERAEGFKEGEERAIEREERVGEPQKKNVGFDV